MNASASTMFGKGTEIDRLLSRQQIYEAVVRYCRGIDRRDRELVLSVYHPDATDDHGVYTGDAVGFVDVPCERGWKNFDTLLHFIGNHLVNFDGDDLARSEAYVIAHHIKHRPDNQAKLDIVTGRYVDRFERRNGEWKIAHRTFVCEWSETRIIDSTWQSETPFVRGQPAPVDLVYEALT